ncbi:MAG: penicillin acylase family protein, partial [Deltaproteobacteria bacterium]|nr:penicillin acylase family protein [Deltaproteobacteria bacterium]
DATTEHDAFFGLGFCQAQDRGFQIELLVRLVHGRLAELVGAEMLDADRLARRIGFVQIAAKQLACMDEASRAQLASFARGVNAGFAHGAKRKPHEMALLGIEPTPFATSDPIAVLQFLSFALSSNWDAELARLRVLRADGADALVALEASLAEWRAEIGLADRLLRDVDVLGAAEELAHGAAHLAATGAAVGASNNWAIAPSRTATGRPILAGDPHLAPTLPAPWYLAHVRTPDWAFTGACFVTQPVVSIGHNAHGAWAVTAAHVDNTDLFVEHLGEDGTSVRDGDRYVACEVRDEVIRVKGGPDVVERVLVTPRGPIVGPALGEHRDALSMRATWMAPRAIGAYGLFRARSIDEMRACYVAYPGISENRVFATADGHVAWQIVGDTPVRKKGHGLLPSPGWDPSAGWEAEPRPFDELPSLRDPAIGFVASANQCPPERDHGTDPFLGADWLDGYRYDRIVERLASRDDWTVDACVRLQLDRTSLLWRELRDAFLSAARDGSGRLADPDLAVALRLLEAWDGDVAPSSSAASVFELAFADLAVRISRARAPNAWKDALGQGINAVLVHGAMPLRRVASLSRLLRDQPSGFFDDGWADAIRGALARAVGWLRSHHGAATHQWAWGRVRPLHLRHPVATQRPFDRVFSLPPVSVGGDVTTIPQASVDFQHPTGDPIGIANLRAVIDVGSWEQSRWSLAGGQSGNPCSAHFGDLLPIWESGEGIDIAWTPRDVARRARTTLRLVPR